MNKSIILVCVSVVLEYVCQKPLMLSSSETYTPFRLGTIGIEADVLSTVFFPDLLFAPFII